MDDYRQSEVYCQYFSKRGWATETVGSTKILIKKIPFLGTILRIQRGPSSNTLADIDNFAKKNKALMLFIESDIKTENADYKEFDKTFKLLGYKNINLFLSPTKTTYIDLSKSETAILASFDQDIRKQLKRNSKKNISFKTVGCMDEFYSIDYETSRRGKYFVHSFKNWKAKWEPFGDEVQFILAYIDGELLGGNMFTVQPPVAFGLSLPSTVHGKSNRIAATLIWEGIKRAKALGCTKFDLNGLYDERYNAPIKWVGLTAFKRKFKGNEVEFMHPKIKIYKWYLRPLERLGLLWMFFVDA